MGVSLQPLKQPRMHSSLCFVASLAVVSANVGSQVSFNGMTHAVNHLAGGDRLAAAAHASALQAQGFQGGFRGFQGPATTGFQGPATAGFQGPATAGFQGQFQGFQGPAAAPAAPAFQATPAFQAGQQRFQSAAAFQGAAPAFQGQAAPGGFVNFQG